MFKFTIYIFSFLVLLFGSLSNALPTQAATVINGIFLDVTYEEVLLNDKRTEKQPSKLTLINEQGKTITLNIDKYTTLFVNSTPTSIGAFKEGMWVEATVDLRKVKELNGFADIEQGRADAIGDSFTGTVNEIDKSGSFISINLKDKKSKKFYVDQQTEIFKDNKLVDLSALYAGDRVKFKLSDYNSSLIGSLEIIADGIKVEHLYKGTIQQIDSTQKKLVVKDEKAFQNWNWQLISSTKGNLTSKSFTAKTPIYIGNKKVEASQLRNYINNEIYYVTITQSGQEVIQKIIIKQTNERNLHETLSSVDTSSQKIRLSNSGNIPYHKGTIIIRNGRLVDPSTLSQGGDAYVITNGTNSHQYANVIHITNDGFQSSNLSNHEIYFGQINSIGTYQVTLTNTSRLTNNYWYSSSYANLNFSNDTVVVEDYNASTKDFKDSIGKNAYFYVKDNHVVAARIVGLSAPAPFISVGRYDGTNWYPNSINLKDVSLWQSGTWFESTQINYLDVTHTTLIKEGSVISIDDLKQNDRLFIIHDNYSQARIILVD